VLPRLVAATLATLWLLSSACSRDGSDPEAGTSPRPKGAKATGLQGEAGLEAAASEEFRYDPTGKPDPFRSFVKAFLSQQASETTGPLEKFDLSQLEVSAIVWGTDNPKALISDPAGNGYIVQEGTPIGKNRGRIVRIDDNLVLVTETYVDFHGEATTKDIEMRLHPIQGG
jgi:type IV pilus assembly protein PilP